MTASDSHDSSSGLARRTQELSLPDFAAKLRETGYIRRLLELARDEDLMSSADDQPHDWTGELMFTPEQHASANLVIREEGIVAGLAFVPDIINVFLRDNERMDWTPKIKDGTPVDPSTTLGTLSGSSIALVRIERTILNLLSRLSGIATKTNHAVQLVQGTNTHICDTRKTTPGLRVFEKYAVRCGGGTSHRMGLHDALLIKDNHLAGLDESAFKARVHAASIQAREHKLEFVQVEVDTLEQLGWLLSMDATSADIVLLDNMPPETLTKAVTMRNESNPNLLLEASGGINDTTLPAVAKSGVDRISMGALTHQAISLDIGLDTL
ncbi:MAG: carboxylating nicotinate-nucleotide diphosphorylase [Phycisphaerales bacterium]